MAEVASAYVSLLPSAQGFGRRLDSQIGPDIEKSGRSSGKRFGGAFKGVVGPALGIAVTAATVGFLKGSIDEAREAQKVGAQTRAVIKSTGGAARVTAYEFGYLANAISKKTGIDDEQIQAGENMLATFTRVRNRLGQNNDIFTQATKTAVDLGVATKTGPVQANLLLGKALNDPAKGLARLTKIGVTFTDGQKKQVAAMVKAGDVAGAQRVILHELNKEFGGSAEAQATAGEKARVAFGNLQEQVGTALLPTIDKLATFLTMRVIPALSVAVSYLQKNPAVIYAAAAAFGVLAVAVIAATAPISLTVLGIAALVAGLTYAYTSFPKFRDGVNSAFQALRQVVAAVLPYVISYVKGMVNVILGVVKIVSGIFHGDWAQVWEGVKQVVRGAVSMVLAVLRGMGTLTKNIIRALGAALLSLAKAAFGQLRAGAVAGANTAVQFVKSIPKRIGNALGDLGSLLFEAGKAVIRGLINGIKSMIGAAVNAAKSAAHAVADAAKGALGIHSPSRVFHEIGVNTGLGLANGIDSQSASIAKAAQRMTGSAITPAARLDPSVRPSGTQAPAGSLDSMSPQAIRAALDGMSLEVELTGGDRAKAKFVQAGLKAGARL